MNAFADYAQRLKTTIDGYDWAALQPLADLVREAWSEGRHIYLCGNGGSAGNAIHLANDYLYGVAKSGGKAIRVTALPANAAVLTCLANDIAYDAIYSQQLETLARKDDVLIVLSGSGNSPNVVKAIEKGREIGMRTVAILGYSGGRCKELAEFPIHFAVDDMQISQDMQLVVGHMLMQWLYANPPENV